MKNTHGVLTSHLFAIIFLDFKSAGNVALGHTKFTYVINFELKKCLHGKCTGLVKYANHFTVCLDVLTAFKLMTYINCMIEGAQINLFSLTFYSHASGHVSLCAEINTYIIL